MAHPLQEESGGSKFELRDQAPRFLAVIQKERECSQAIKWHQGLSPKEHLMIRLEEETRQWRAEQELRQQRFEQEVRQSDQEREERQRQEDLKRQDQQRTDDLERQRQYRKEDRAWSVKTLFFGALVGLVFGLLLKRLEVIVTPQRTSAPLVSDPVKKQESPQRTMPPAGE
jgi:hypothetical protein